MGSLAQKDQFVAGSENEQIILRSSAEVNRVTLLVVVELNKLSATKYSCNVKGFPSDHVIILSNFQFSHNT